MAKAKFTVFEYRLVLIAGVFGNDSCLGTGPNQGAAAIRLVAEVVLHVWLRSKRRSQPIGRSKNNLRSPRSQRASWDIFVIRTDQNSTDQKYAAARQTLLFTLPTLHETQQMSVHYVMRVRLLHWREYTSLGHTAPSQITRAQQDA
jgi:hypothetical protein